MVLFVNVSTGLFCWQHGPFPTGLFNHQRQSRRLEQAPKGVMTSETEYLRTETSQAGL